jgi:hypothetical protein
LYASRRIPWLFHALQCLIDPLARIDVVKTAILDRGDKLAHMIVELADHEARVRAELLSERQQRYPGHHP